jgi:hypothetical protein
VLVAMLAATAAGIHQTAGLRVTGFVDGHWRGAYDILVRPAGTRLDLESTNGLVEPDFVGLGGRGGISLDQLAAIRSISGVEMAAPIGFVGFMRGTAPLAVINLDHLPSKPTLYKLTVTTTTTDGLSRQVVQSEEGEVLLGPPAAGPDPTASWATTFGSISAGQDASGAWQVDIMSGHALPDLEVPVIAVDPVSEEELLAGNAAFLDAFRKLAGAGFRAAGTFDPGWVAPGYLHEASSIANIQSATYPWPSDRQLPVIPLVVSSRQAASLQVQLQVQQIGQALADYPASGSLADAESAAGSGLTTVGTSSVDAGSTIAPLRVPELAVPWPGSASTGGVTGIYQSSAVDTRLMVRPTYTVASSAGPDGGAPAFRITPVGAVGPDDDPNQHRGDAPTTSVSSGSFQAYRQLVSVPMATGTTGFEPHAAVRQPFLLAPIGTFDATAVKIPTDPLDYVPLGAYDPADTTYVADTGGKPVTPTAMQYPLLPNGLVTTPPLAITDLGGAVALRGNSPIDAVRVRVAGVTDFGPDSQARIQAAAAAISRMGFDVDIVAGSSPQQVDVYVPEYNTDQSPATDLGWVRQHWTTIGAAQRVVGGFDQADLALLILSLLATTIWAFALAGLRSERRIRDVGVLKAIGWDRWEILRWLMGEPIIAGVAIGALAVLSYLAGGGNPEALAVGIGMALVWAIAGLVAGLDALRRGRPSAQSGSPTPTGRSSIIAVKGPVSYAIRAAALRWAWVLATAAGIAAGATSIATAAAIIIGIGDRIGPTLLATATGSAMALYQPLALAVIGFGSLVFVVASLRLDRRRRAPEALILSVCGWSGDEIDRLLWLGLLVVGFLAALLSGVAALLLAGPFRIGFAPGAALGAVALAVSVVVWGGLATKGVHAKPGEIS